jgi:hypothetical protein
MAQTRRDVLRMLGGAACLSMLGMPCFAEEKRRPNVVFILADDLGWMDTSLYGSKFYETPNIDALAGRIELEGVHPRDDRGVRGARSRVLEERPAGWAISPGLVRARLARRGIGEPAERAR